jgi:hypothetical protein
MKISPRIFIPTLIVLEAISCCALKASAQSSFYVSTTGSDSTGNGSITRPWATISYASTKATPGTTIHVAAGTYTGTINTRASGTASAYVTYVADSADFSHPVNCAQVAANHGDLSTCAKIAGGAGEAWVNYGNYVTIQGFDISGQGMNGIYTEGAATKIIGNHVHDVLTSTCNSNGGSGINLNGTNAQVIGNYVHNVGPYPSSCGYVQGIYFLQAGGLAWNNISFNNSGFGIQLWHEPSHIVLANNTIFNNATGGIVLGTDDANFTVDYVTVSNNIVYNNAGWGISEQGASSSSTGIHNVYTNNLVYQNISGSYSLQNGLTPYNTINSNPQFIDYTGNESGDYQLQLSSPAIKTGTNNGAPSYDFNNSSRAQGSIDSGAYQHSSVAASTATASLNPLALAFPGTTVGKTSTVAYATLYNKSNSVLTINGNFSISGPFAFGGLGTCSRTIPAGSSCSISVVFKPTAAGTATGIVTVSDSAGTQTVHLSGTGLP